MVVRFFSFVALLLPIIITAECPKNINDLHEIGDQCFVIHQNLSTEEKLNATKSFRWAKARCESDCVRMNIDPTDCTLPKLSDSNAARNLAQKIFLINGVETWIRLGLSRGNSTESKWHWLSDDKEAKMTPLLLAASFKIDRSTNQCIVSKMNRRGSVVVSKWYSGACEFHSDDIVAPIIDSLVCEIRDPRTKPRRKREGTEISISTSTNVTHSGAPADQEDVGRWIWILVALAVFIMIASIVIALLILLRCCREMRRNRSETQKSKHSPPRRSSRSSRSSQRSSSRSDNDRSRCSCSNRSPPSLRSRTPSRQSDSPSICTSCGRSLHSDHSDRSRTDRSSPSRSRKMR